MVVVWLGIPLLAAYLYARLLPMGLWFRELGYGEVFSDVLTARLTFHLIVTAVVWVFITANLVLARPRPWRPKDGTAIPILVLAALIVSDRLAAHADAHWETMELWRHQQAFGQSDPIHGKDIGFFVFVLPFQLQVSQWLMIAIVLAAVFVTIVYALSGRVDLRPLQATQAAKTHLALLLTCFLLNVAWRLDLARYQLELGQPPNADGGAVPGAGYVDVNVRTPLLNALITLAVMLAVVSLLSPLIALDRLSHSARLFASTTVGVIVIGLLAAGALAPPLAQHYLVDPNPLLSEQRFIARSLTATRTGLGLDRVQAAPYEPSGFDAAAFSASRERLSLVGTWDPAVLEARMRELASDVPYFRPDSPSLGIEKAEAGTRVTVTGTRELNPPAADDNESAWINDRLAYTHGLGTIRYSATEVDVNREPVLIDNGLGPNQPRIYFGNLSDNDPATAAATEHQSQPLLTPVMGHGLAATPWVLANSRRPEVDAPASDESAPERYHYDGSGGIVLSNWVRKAVFALSLQSRDIWLSEDITPQTRLMLHRDVHDRLESLAHFITWDSSVTPLTTEGRLVFVVHGYTTTDNYPYAARFELGKAQVNYARSSVVATVDAFTGAVKLYVTETEDPIIRAWRAAYPDLFTPLVSMPADLRGRLPYPTDLFNAQATAYERYHTTRPDVFVADSDKWSRPIALAGPIEVAGNIDFDESDEDDLRQTLAASDIAVNLPQLGRITLVRRTYFTPRGGQNLVATLNGWVGDDGRTSLEAQILSRDPVTLGPAQVSRLVFATPRVQNLLGLRNLEIRDLDKSSLDSVILGRPRLLLLPGGPIQIQALYEGSRGAGAARLLGVTAFVNGRAGLGPDIQSAVRQALNRPPKVTVRRPSGTVWKGERVVLRFDVENARRERVTITSPSGDVKRTVTVANGRGRVAFTPRAAGSALFRVDVVGLDGTRTSGSIAFEVLDTPPSVQILTTPTAAEVGRAVNVRFRVAHAVSVSAQVSTRAGVVLTRRYELADGRGLVRWTPDTAGQATLRITVLGHQDQRVSERLTVFVLPSASGLPPAISFVRIPQNLVAGRPAVLEVQASGCTTAAVRITGGGGEARKWTVPCPASPARITWTPTRPGTFIVTLAARNAGTVSQASISLTVRAPP